MPKGPKGEVRPTDPIAAAIMTARIATGDLSETEAAAEVAHTRKRRKPTAAATMAGDRSTKK